jgi:hypothetical protein
LEVDGSSQRIHRLAGPTESAQDAPVVAMSFSGVGRAFDRPAGFDLGFLQAAEFGQGGTQPIGNIPPASDRSLRGLVNFDRIGRSVGLEASKTEIQAGFNPVWPESHRRSECRDCPVEVARLCRDCTEVVPRRSGFGCKTNSLIQGRECLGELPTLGMVQTQ